MSDDDCSLMDDLRVGVSQFEANVAALAQVLEGYATEVTEFQHLDDDIRRLETTSRLLCGSVEKATQIVVPGMLADIEAKNQQLDQLCLASRNCEATVKAQREKISQLETELKAVRDQAVGQFESVSWIGSIMGAMLWKSCKQHESVKALIGTDSLRDFLGMANCVLSSFLARQGAGGAALSSDSEDYKFLATICGCLTNLAAFPEGRTHLAIETDGLLFANNLLLALDLFRMPEGRLLKRMSLTFVFNICLENNGAKFVLGDEARLGSIVRCLDQNNSQDVLTLSVSLLVRLIKSVPEYRTRAEIALQIPRVMVKQITSTSNQELKETASHLLELVEFDWIKAAINNGK
ncbi:uncharacterized protein LOC5575281 isoform X2 [Aedes aegypti]|uniref:Uncharacterized protein n=1 Tax=Aedes aegypti TaxID=7159 RepID=A0A903UPY2_AEDAE|nr:uncharacterized protein LOC5575281 isoform X2 [Aedes aegypti]